MAASGFRTVIGQAEEWVSELCLELPDTHELPEFLLNDSTGPSCGDRTWWAYIIAVEHVIEHVDIYCQNIYLMYDSMIRIIYIFIYLHVWILFFMCSFGQ